MIPFGLNESQFSVRYRRELDRVSATVIANLHSHLSRVVEPSVQVASIEIFVDEYGAAPNAYIYYLGERNKVDRTDQSLFAGRAMDLELPLSALSEFDERYFLSLEDGEFEFPGLNLASNILKSWVAECWWKAGGWTYSVPTTVTVHDDRGDGSAIQLTAATR